MQASEILGLDALYQELSATFPADRRLQNAADRVIYETDWQGSLHNPAVEVLMPCTTDEVAKMVRICRRHGIAIVPQGGNTGLAGGAVPVPERAQAILSLQRLNRIRDINPLAATMTLEAGVILQVAQEAAAEHDMLLPLSIAAEGSACIGGVISTNAGGIQALTYGTMRNLVLGVEVVLADGRIWDGVRALRKDNTGLDLKQLFIGSEGTLGIITAACIRLEQKPDRLEVALLTLRDVEAAMEVFRSVRTRFGTTLTSCEYFTDRGLSLVLQHIPRMRLPLGRSSAYVLLELSCGRPDGDVLSDFTECLAELLEAGHITDATIANNDEQRRNLWALRENITEGERGAGGAIKHDVAVPLASLAKLISMIEENVAALWPGARPNIFGHLGDGNLHVNILPPENSDLAAVPVALLEAVRETIEESAIALKGTFSAEHGVGQTRAAALLRYRSKVEIELMCDIKRVLDPAWQLNPGKILPQDL